MKLLKKMSKDKKGFTLVEMIVILVILAILAAILVPALLGYIDQAKEKQYVEEAHSIYTAIQAYENEQYAKSGDPVTDISNADMKTYIDKLVDPTKVTSGTITMKGSGTHEKYTVSSIADLIFTSQTGDTVTISMDSKGNWSTAKIASK